MMWTMIGYPPCSHVVPIMIDNVPTELQPNESWHSTLCDEVVERKHQVFSIKRGSGKYYIDMDLLRTIMPQQEAISRSNYDKGYKMREKRAKSLKK